MPNEPSVATIDGTTKGKSRGCWRAMGTAHPLLRAICFSHMMNISWIPWICEGVLYTGIRNEASVHFRDI